MLCDQVERSTVGQTTRFARCCRCPRMGLAEIRHLRGRDTGRKAYASQRCFAGRPEISPGRRARRRHRRSLATKTAAWPVPPRESWVHPGLPDHRRLAGRDRSRRLPHDRSGGARSILHPQGERGRLGRLRADHRLRSTGGWRRRAQTCGGGGGAVAGGREFVGCTI